MANLDTFEGPDQNMDPLYSKQREDVARMRASLLACSGDPKLTKNAIQQVAVMQVYHQVSRIIRYLDMMDKLEDRLYQSIDSAVNRADPRSNSTWIMLSSIQEKLQKSMIESNKLLTPYIEMANNMQLFDLTPPVQPNEVNSGASILNADQRDRVRNNAQAVLLQLRSG